MNCRLYPLLVPPSANPTALTLRSGWHAAGEQLAAQPLLKQATLGRLLRWVLRFGSDPFDSTSLRSGQAPFDSDALRSRQLCLAGISIKLIVCRRAPV